MFNLKVEKSARRRQIDGVRFVAEYPYEYEENGEKKPWVFIASDSDDQSVATRFDALVQDFRKGKHRFGPRKALGRKSNISHVNLLKLRQEAFIDRAIHYLEFGFEDADGIRIYKADSKSVDELRMARTALVEFLWTTRLEVGSDLISNIADHVRDAGGEDTDREKD